MKTLNRQDVNSCKHQQYSKTADTPILILPLHIIFTHSPLHRTIVSHSQHLPTLQWIFWQRLCQRIYRFLIKFFFRFFSFFFLDPPLTCLINTTSSV